MLSTLFLKKKPAEPLAIETSSKYLQAKTGRALLEQPERQALITKVKRAFSVTEDVWNTHYLFAIETFAEIAQELPASEIHHHSKQGGLIDHTLEALFSGVRVSQGYILPPNTEAEKISASSDRWRFGVFIAILVHDLGKVVTDLEVVFKNEDDTFEKWHPWFGSIPLNAEYAFRYRERLKISRIEKSLHEKATMSLLPKILTKKATFWMFEDAELVSQLFNTVTHSTFGGGAVSEIVRKADSSSVSKNLGAETGMNSNYSSSIPLHEKLLTGLRNLIQDGELIRNRPGAALWVTEHETWLVSKPSMEATQAKLLNEGHKGIPKSVVRLYEILKDHDLLVATPEGNSVWTCAIHDYSNNWKMELTFLRFKNEVLFPTTNPERFNGSITPLDADGNPVDKPNREEVSNERNNKKENEEKSPEVKPKKVEKIEGEGGNQITVKRETKKTTKQQVAHEARSIKSDLQACDSDFLLWMIKEIAKRKLRVNEPKAMIHIVDDYVALVTPEIFITYLKRNTLKATVYERRAGDKPAYTAVQKEVENLQINKKSTQGRNIHKMLVEGPHKQSKLRAYLIDRKALPSLANFNTNLAIKIDE